MSIRFITMLFSNLSKTAINLVSRRYSRRKSNYKFWPNDWVPFHWSRPEKKPGWHNPEDLVPLENPKPDQLQTEVRYSDELRQLGVDNPLRKIYSLDHAKRSQHNKSQVESYMRELGLVHEVDYTNSLEAKIINLTFTLRQMIENVETTQTNQDGRFNGHIRDAAHRVKNRRYRYLCDLKELHSERYQRIIEALKLEPKENKINVPYVRPWRKKQLRALTIEYSKDMVEKKVDEFMKSIEIEKKNFEKEKQETLRWIEEQEKLLEQS